MNRIKSFLLASMFLLPTMAQQAAAPAIPQDKKIEQKVEALLKKKTLEEKIGHERNRHTLHLWTRPKSRDNLHNGWNALSSKALYGLQRPLHRKRPLYISAQDLGEKDFAPFLACVKAGGLSIMTNSCSVNGLPVHANYKILT